jgi:hypothetical protein
MLSPHTRQCVEEICGDAPDFVCPRTNCNQVLARPPAAASKVYTYGDCPICYGKTVDWHTRFSCGHDVCLPCTDRLFLNSTRDMNYTPLQSARNFQPIKCPMCRAHALPSSILARRPDRAPTQEEVTTARNLERIATVLENRQVPTPAIVADERVRR